MSDLTQALERIDWDRLEGMPREPESERQVIDAAKSWRALYEPCSTCGGTGRVATFSPYASGNPDPCPDCVDGEQPTTKAVETLAQLFHENYERLAPEFGYETRKATRTPWPPSNADLMRASVRAALLELRRQL